MRYKVKTMTFKSEYEILSKNSDLLNQNEILSKNYDLLNQNMRY